MSNVDPFLRNWVLNNWHINLHPFQEQCFHILCRAFGCGIYDLPISRKAILAKERTEKAYSTHGHYFSVNLRFPELATFDGGSLTMLVIASYQECVRVSLEAIARGVWKVRMHPQTYGEVRNAG